MIVMVNSWTIQNYFAPSPASAHNEGENIQKDYKAKRVLQSDFLHSLKVSVIVLCDAGDHN